MASGAASSVLRQLPQQLNPVIFITNTLEKTFGHRAEVKLGQPLFASRIPGTVAPTQTISGTLYDSAGAPITSGRTIKLLQNGTSFGTTTNASGGYGFTGVTLASGDKIAVYIVGASEKGATVTLSGTSDITNLNIRQNSLIVRTDNGGSITNANLKEAEGGAPDPDLTAVRMLDGSNVLTLPAGFNLQIWPGSTFAPGANIHDAGNWTNNGAFVPGTHTVTFEGNSNQTIAGSSSTTFYELTISNSGTSPANVVTLDGSAGATNTVVSKLNINSGVFDQGTASASSDLEVNGSTFGTCIFVNPGGQWVNTSRRDVTLFCDVSNQGTIEFNSNGTACGQPDDILVRSNVTGIQRTWAGPGTFSMTDVNVRDQRVPGGLNLPHEILVNSGTNAGNNDGWIFSSGCDAYTWIGAFGQDWANPYNWSPVRYTANNAFTSDVLIFDGNVTPSPLVNSTTQTNASIQLKNGVALTLDPIGGGTLTLNGGTGSDLDVPAGTLLKFEGFNPLVISLVGPGHQCDVGGQIIMQGSGHRLRGANPGEITMSGANAFTTQSGFTGNPFGESPNGAVVFQSGSTGTFNAGDDPFGGLNSVVTFNSGSTARFGATSAFSTSGRTYGNLILGGNQNYPTLLAGQTTVQNNFVLESGSSWTLSGDLNLLGNFEDQNLLAGKFNVNSRTVRFQGGSATQTIFKPGSNALTFGDVFIAESPGGKVQLLSSININGQLNLSTPDSLLELNGKTLELNGTVTGAGNLKGSGASTLNIGGIGSLGTLKFLSGFRTLSQLKMDRVLPSGSVTLGNDLMVDDVLLLTSGVVNMGSFTLTINGIVNRSAGYIIGNEQRSFTCLTTTCPLTFDVGTANGYSPVSEVLHLSAAPGTYNQTIKAIEGQHPSIHGVGVNALQRYWSLSSVAGPSFSNADITFKYRGGSPPGGDVAGTESNYKIFRFNGSFTQFDPSVAIDTVNHTATLNGVSTFSDWTLAEAAAVTPGNLQFLAANYDHAEQNFSTHTATITVQRVGGKDGAVSVHWATSAGTATPASDYTENSGDLNWADGDFGIKTFTVTVSGDTAYELNETVNLTLSAPTGGAGLGTPNAATLTITNDDTADSDVDLLGGDLEIIDINGGNTDDTLTVSLNGSNVRINDPNHTLKCGAGATTIDVHTCEVPLASITGSIHVHALAGNDSLTLALAGGNFFPPGGVIYNGGDPTTGSGDRLFITGGSQGTVTYHYTNAHDGSILMSSIGTVTYTGLEPISNTGTATNIIFELPAGPSAATLADDGTLGNTMSRLSGATFENTDFANPTASLTIKRGNAADTVAVNALPDFNASLAIGSAGNELGPITFNGAITLAANNSLAANASSTINLANGANVLTTSGTGTISLTAANITGGGSVSTGAGLTVSNTGTTSTLSGVIAGPGGLTKLGAGTLALLGTNTYTGATAVSLGRLNINGSIDSNTTVSGGATLGGTGTINSTKTLTVNDGVLAPGTSPGIFNTGNVILNGNSTFAVEDGGTTPGNLATNYDQLNVTGTVSLGNATLNLSPLGFTPSAGQTFVIINNDGTDLTTGNFTLGTGGTDENGGSLAEGDTITNFLGSALEATITYQGGTGNNDVVLTAVAPVLTPGNLKFSAANYDDTEQNSGTHLVTITVQRVDGTDGAVSVHWATSAGTATPGSDYTEDSGNLSWIAGNADPQTFTVTVSGDTAYEFNEMVNLTLSAPTGGAGLGTPNPATLTITNDDAADSDVVLGSGNLQITDVNGGNSDDTLTISLNGSNVRINDPTHTLNCGTDTTAIDANTCEVPLALVTGSIQVNTLAGNDSLTLALGGGNFFPPLGITYNGDDPATGPGDKLFITGGSQGTVTYHYTNAHEGSIAMSNVGTVTYTGLEPISNSGTATNVIFELPAGPTTNAATLADDVSVGNTMSRLSGTTFENTDFANPTASLTIKRGNAADTVAVNAPPDFTASLAIGSAGNEFGAITFTDAITLAENNSLSANASSAINLANGANILTTSGTGTISFTAANVAGAGNVSTGGGLTISNTDLISTLSGVVTGTGGLTKLGAGTLVLSGANTYGGETAVNAGRLNVNGSITSNTTVNPTGTLGGTGTINSANTVTVSGGTVAPGTSPGILNTGNVSFDSTSTFAVEIGGDTPGTNHDQLKVTGTVSLGNATLSLTPLSFTPSAGQAFVIINNDGTADAVNGSFNGLPEGATILNFLGSPLKATITYQGGDGNDVVLTAANPVPGNLQFSAANYDDPEQNSLTHTAIITVQRVGGIDGAVSVHWATSAGTATPGSDYTEGTGDLNWANGNADDQTFTVTVVGDTVHEFNETVNLTLSAPTGGAGLGTPNPATLTITNDDVADSHVSLLGGSLQITDVDGSNTADTFTISRNGSNVRVTDPNHTVSCGPDGTAINVNTCEVPLALITGSIQVNTLGESDSLTLALGGGNFFPPGGVIYNGGDPTTPPGDKLFITGGSQGTVTYHYTNAHDGSILMSSIGTVTYTGLEPISNTGTATDLIFELPPGSNDATLADDGPLANTMSRLSGATFETTDFANPTASLTIKRGSAADTVAVNALPDFDASLTIGSFSTITFTGPITLAANNSLVANASVAIDLSNGPNLLTTSGTGTISLTAANLTGGGYLSTSGGLTISNTGSSSILSGVIAGTGGLTKLGAGTLVLSGANTYTGATVVSVGQLNIDGSIDSNTTVNSGATLGGRGAINSTKTLTVNGGVLAPGASPGIFNTGNVTLNGTSTFAVEIGGADPGNLATNHDQLKVTGTVSLGNATLSLTPLSFTPLVGQPFVIIDNDGTADAVNGTFNGLPEGAKILNFLGSPLKATITYAGGDGNDVVLTAANPVPGNLQFSAANYDDTEQNSTAHPATITVKRVGGIDGPVSVHWATSAVTATPGSDYTEGTGDLNWADGDTADKTFTVMVSGDTSVEADETVNLTLSAPTGGAGLGTPNPATLTITNDDHAPVANDLSDSTGLNTLKTITMSSTDADGDAQTFSIVDSPQHGTLGSISAPVCSSGSCTATVDYTPTTGYVGADSFTYKTNDGANDSNTATVSITVNAPCPVPPPIKVNTTDDTDDANALTTADGTCADSNGNCSLRAAIQEANAAAASCGTIDINFDPTVFAEATAPHEIFWSTPPPALQHNVNINGPGADILRVNGGDNQIFVVDPGYTVLIAGLTLTGGIAPDGNAEGGAVLNDHGTVTINDCILTGNSAEEGGAIYTDGGSLTMNNCVVEGNTALGDGGGLYNFGSIVTLNKSRFDSNDSDGDGGGIFNCGGGSLFMGTTTVSGNWSLDTGAGIFNETGTTAEITDSTISSNDAYDGGAIFNGGTLKLINSTISGNTAMANGGGIYNDAAGVFTFANVTVTDNHCDDDDFDDGNGPGDGGGIYVAGGPDPSHRLLNTIVSGNFQGSIFVEPVPNNIAGSGVVTGSFNLIGTGSGGLNNTIPNQGNLLNVDDPKLAPLGDYGGPTQTHFLLGGSPAIDKGSNCVIDDTCDPPPYNHQLAYDQRGLGFPRQIDGDSNGTATVDIGAFELQVIVVNATEDSDDGQCEPLSPDHDCTLREAMTAANLHPGSMIRFEIPTSGPTADTGCVSGVCTISPTQNLPQITKPVFIDGYTQSGAQPNTLTLIGTDPSLAGDNAVLKLIIDGTGVPIDGRGFDLQAGSDFSTIRGLAISHWSAAGIYINDSSFNTISGNFIGTDVTGSSAVGNGTGVIITSGCTPGSNGSVFNTIGGEDPAARNVISGNGANGIDIGGSDGFCVALTTVEGNYIGADHSGLQAVPNATNGVTIQNLSQGNTIGCEVLDGDNLISGNGNAGVLISNTDSFFFANVVQGNFIGTDRTAAAPLSNGQQQYGVVILDSQNNFIGIPGFGNVISGNSKDGVFIQGGVSNLIQGNFIGTNLNGDIVSGLGNSTHGIELSVGPSGNSIDNFIGGDLESCGCKVARQTAVRKDTVSAANRQINNRERTPAQLQTIARIAALLKTQAAKLQTAGAQAAKTAPSNAQKLKPQTAKAQAGKVQPARARSLSLAEVQNSSGGNVIAGNGGDGVRVGSDGDFNNFISQNSIYSNGGLGINLGTDGVTPNDTADHALGPNHYQNFPVITDATASDQKIIFTLPGASGTAQYLAEFFVNDICDGTHGEGQKFLGSTIVTGGAPSYNFTAPGPVNFTNGKFITATATDSANNTSEFSACFSVLGATTTVITNATALSTTPSTFNTPFMVQWSVTPSAGGTPTGNVTVTVAASTDSCTAPVGDNQCQITPTSAGTKQLTATYSGDATFASSSSSPAVSHVVDMAATTTTISNAAALSSTPSNAGDPFTVTWTVSSTPAGATGTVSVTIDGSPGCNAAVSAGQCDITPSTAGTKSLVAHYSGDGNFLSSDSSPVNHVVNGPLISGHVDYCITPGANVPNVSINVTGSQTTSTTTDASGNYSINLPEAGSYTLTPTKTALAPMAPGIDTADVIGAQRHFMGLAPLSDCPLTAANANPAQDSIVDTVDAIAIQQFFLGASSGTADVGKWQFNPANRQYPNLTASQLSRDYSALVIGDITGDVTPTIANRDFANSAAHPVTPSTVSMVSLPVANVGTSVTNVTQPVTTTNIDVADNLVGFQGDFTFDSSVVTFQVAPASPAGLTATNWNVSANILGAGTIKTLRISAFSTTSTPLSGSGTLFNLNFTRVSNIVGASTPLQWAQAPNNFVFIDTSLNKQAPANTPDGSVTIVGPTASNGSVSGQILDNSGNPVEGAAVRMNGSQNRLTVTDAAGRYHFDQVETNGLYVVTPSRPNFTFSPPQRTFNQLGANTEATFTAAAGGGSLNPLDTTEYFVRQQYLDFLGREPDEAGFNFWVNNLESCGNDLGCREVKRIDTSAAFFLSIEFQQTGYVVYRTYQAAFGDLRDAPVPLQLTEFRGDAAQISKGVVVLRDGWQRALETNKKLFAEDFVKRARFAAAYPLTMTPAEFVDKLFANAAIPLTDDDHAAAIVEFARAADTSDVAARGRVLRQVAENSILIRRRFNRAFVLMEYFGYLRRDPNSGQDRDFAGYTFWLDKLDRFDGNFQEAEMVKAFLSSIEYRARFPR